MGLADEKYLSLTTFRKSGAAVPTPLWCVDLGDGAIGFWTNLGSGKVKRLAHTPRVTVQPCSARGAVKAGTEPVEGTGRLATPDELAEIRSVLRAKYGVMARLIELSSSVGKLVSKKRRADQDCGIVVSLT